MTRQALITAHLEALNRKDVERVLAIFDVNAECDAYGEKVRGTRAIAKELETVMRRWETITYRPEAWYERGDHVICFSEVSAVGHGRWLPDRLNARVAQRWVMDGDAAISLESFILQTGAEAWDATAEMLLEGVVEARDETVPLDPVTRLTELRALGDLRSRGLLTEVEFEAEKLRILGS